MTQAIPTRPVGKTECAAALGWHRQKLDRVLARDAAFPRHVGAGGRTLFFMHEVHAHLGGEARRPPAPIDLAQLRDAVRPPELQERSGSPGTKRNGAIHAGEATARQRKEEADARLKEIKLDAHAGKLLEAWQQHQAAATVIASLANDLDAMPSEIVKRGGLPEELEPVIQAIVDDLRKAMVERAKGTLRAELPLA